MRRAVLVVGASAWMAIGCRLGGPPSGSQRVDGGWFTVDLPQSWQPAPLETDKRRAMFAGRWRSPEPEPDVQLMIPRPVPVPAGATLDAAAVILATAYPNPTRGSGTLSGHPAETLLVDVPGPVPTRSRTWLVIVDGQMINLTCVGRGAGAPLADELCGQVIGSFRLTDLPTAPRYEPAPPVRRRVGPLELPIPPDWVPLTSDWLEPVQIGGFRAPNPSTGAWETYQVAIALFPGVSDGEALADALDASLHASMRKVGRQPVQTPLGPGLRTELSDGVSTASWVVHLAVQGTGVEVWCSVPTRLREEASGLCGSMVAGASLAP